MHRSTTQEGGLIDARGAAELLGVKASQVYRLAELGRLPVHRVGRYLRFDRGELLAWTAQGHQEEADVVERLLERQGEAEDGKGRG